MSKNTSNCRSKSDIITKYESKRVFSKVDIDEEMMKKIEQIVLMIDGDVGILGTSPRIHLHNPGLGAYIYRNEIGWIIGSYFESKVEEERNNVKVDIAYKLMKVILELESLNFNTSIALNSLYHDKVDKETKDYHKMNFVAPIGICFGSNGTNSVLGTLIDFIYSSHSRINISDILYENSYIPPSLQKIFNDAIRCPSCANTQTWGIVIDNNNISFYATSQHEYRFYNIGFFIACFEALLKEYKIRGEWNVLKNPQKIDGDYIITFSCR